MKWPAWLAASFILLAEAAHFDYVIVGGGTCGLAVANRLSELSNVTVAIIEAGGDVRNNPNVTNPDLFTLAFDTPIDWSYDSEKQTNAGNRVLHYHSGKAIGGTSTINGMTYLRGQKAQVDAWETIGNKGWNWDSLFPYYKKAENYDPPTKAQVAAGASYEAHYHGFAGHVHVGYPYDLLNGSFHTMVQDGWKTLGQPLNKDANSGSVRGFDIWPRTVIRELSLRDDAATAYYWPVSNRTNLKIFRGTATKITWASGKDVVASGVEYQDTSGKTAILKATKEVILSAGSLRSPPLLEQSGIGNPQILSANSIATKVALPGVGENLIDQTNIELAYLGNKSYNGIAPYATFATAADYFGAKNVSAVAASVNGSIPKWAAHVVAANNNYTSVSSIEYLFKVQHDLIFNQAVPSTEILTTEVATTFISAYWPLLPFSRGNVHIGTTPDTPRIDPKFYEFDYDVETSIAVGRMVRAFWGTDAVNHLVVNNTVPGPKALPPHATDQEWTTFLKSSFNSNYHPLGTAAMMPKELGGVVDPELKVYGTRNVRVVDASIMPMQISGHLTATLYAIAERASDIIKASM